MSLHERRDVMVVGDVFVDMILSGFGSWPQPGEEAFAEKLWRETGGGAAITACGLARLGVNARLMAVVGDEDGAWLIERLTTRGVDTSGVWYHPREPTGLTVSVSTAVDRAFFTYFGANVALSALLADTDARRVMSIARHVHLACAPQPELLIDLTRELRAANCTVSLDVGWQEAWLKNSDSLRALKELDLFLPNEREAQLMTGESKPEMMLRAFGNAGVRCVALKLGSNGAALLLNEEVYTCRPYSVQPLDTTGAGDCFDAGFIYALLQRVSPERCLAMASICGALSTEGLGGVASFPTRDELDAAMKTKKAEQVDPSATNPQR